MLKKSVLVVLWVALMCSLFSFSKKSDVLLSSLPYEHISNLTSFPGETKSAFLQRVAPSLRAYSDKTGFEACGVIATGPQGGFSVVLGSSHSHLACVNDPSHVLEGYTLTGETFHSHGTAKQFVVNKADKLLMDPQIADQLETARRRMLAGQSLFHFSPADFASGPGYLATPNGVIYQHGENKSVTSL